MTQGRRLPALSAWALVVTTMMFSGAQAGAVGATGSGCRSGDPMANVRDPGRLKVVSACQSASGAAVQTRNEGDGDVLVLIRPDPGSAHLLNAGNRARGGVLWLEIVPADQPGCTPGKRVHYGTCTGADVPTPKVGAHVTATGPYVEDTAHKPAHMELHPAWSIIVH